MRTLINGENLFNGIHEKSRNENKIPVIVNVQISENGTFPFSLFRIPKTRIRKFSVLSLTHQPSSSDRRSAEMLVVWRSVHDFMKAHCAEWEIMRCRIEGAAWCLLTFCLRGTQTPRRPVTGF